MLLLKNVASKKSSSFKSRRRYDAYANNQDSSDSESDLSPDPESESDSEAEDIVPMKGKLYKSNNEKLHRYFTPGTGREVIENLAPRRIDNRDNQQRGSLDSQKLDVKKIEYKKKIDIVWNSIISKYSAFDENDQGDVINLKDFSIEEDTGHIEKLQNFQRTNIWNDINELEEVDDYEEDMDPSEDPINLLSIGKQLRNGSKSSILENSRVSTPRVLRTSSTSKSTTNKAAQNDDPIAMLTPRKTSRISTRASSPRRRSLLQQRRHELASPMRSTRNSSPSRSMVPPVLPTSNDMNNDPLSLLTPNKISKVTTRTSSPHRKFSIIRGPSQSSPLASMAPPSIRSSLNTTQQETLSPAASPRELRSSTTRDPIINLSSPKASRRPTRPSSPTPVSRNHTSTQSHQEISGPRFTNPSIESRGRAIERNRTNGGHSSPVRQLLATLPKTSISVLTKTRRNSWKRQIPMDIDITKIANKTRRVGSEYQQERRSSPDRNFMQHLAPRPTQVSSSSTNSQSTDPLNLLTPRAASRIGSRRTTRASSPIRSTNRTTPTRPEQDPLCLLTPRSSTKKSSRSSQRSSKQFETIHENHQLLPPPPPPQFQPTNSSISTNEQNSPFIRPPLPRVDMTDDRYVRQEAQIPQQSQTLQLQQPQHQLQQQQQFPQSQPQQIYLLQQIPVCNQFIYTIPVVTIPAYGYGYMNIQGGGQGYVSNVQPRIYEFNNDPINLLTSTK